MQLIGRIFAFAVLTPTLLFGKGACQNTTNITDALMLKTLQEYGNVCPYTDLCFSSRKDNFPRLQPQGDKISEPCCEDCSCGDMCGNACCPDIPSNYVTIEEARANSLNTTRCVRLQYKTIPWNYTRVGGYYTVLACPNDYPDNDINAKCVQDYQDFDFVEHVTHLVPVTSGKTIYKNKFCALCNGALLETMEFWDMEIRCIQPSVFPTVHSLIEVKKAVENDERCDIVFNPIIEVPVGYRCVQEVDRCNVSGLWLEYDSDIERACMSYTSFFKYIYKNVHCYMCNIGATHQVPIVCERGGSSGFVPNSFVALLDFQGLLRASTPQQSRPSDGCPGGYVYDSVKDICLQLFCPEYMYVSEGACKPLFLMLKDSFATVYDVTISVEPRAAFKNNLVLPGSVETMYYSIWHSVTNALEAVQSPFEMCHIFGFLVLRQDIPSLIDDFGVNERKHLSFSEIKLFAFKLKIHGAIRTDLNEELKHLDNIFANYTQEPELLPYIIRFRDIPLDLFDSAIKMMDEYGLRGNPKLDRQLSRLMLDSVLHTAFAAGYTHEPNGLTIAPLSNTFPFNFRNCIPIALYQLQPFCPKIQLLEDEFNITDDGIQLSGGHHFLSNQELIFTLNTTVLVCYKTYFAGLNIPITQYQKVDVLPIDPIMIVTSITLSLSLTSLVISFIVYAILPSLRTLPGLNIMGLIGSLSATHLLTLLNGIIRIRLHYLCIAFGVILHLSIMISTFWMFVCSYHMAQVFLKHKKINPKSTNKFRIFIRHLGFTFTMAVLFVVTNVLVSSVRSNRISLGYDAITCYLDSTDMVLYTVAIPIGVVVLTNIILFTAVALKLGRTPSIAKNRNIERNNLAIFAKLSTLTGMTWCFGFLYQFTNVETFAYIFVLLNASQGLFIMVAFVLNRRIVSMIKTHYRDSFLFPSAGTSTRTAANGKSVVHISR